MVVVGRVNQEDRRQKETKLYFSYDISTIYVIVILVPNFSSQCMLPALGNG